MDAKTHLFTTCAAVFQGGGCRASALAGAYSEARRLGINFSEVAGTSAGAIMAALVGAGAEPSQIIEILSSLDFKLFLAPPESVSKKQSLRMLGLGWLLSCPGLSQTKPIGMFLRRHGQYSSAEIERWMEKTLAALLPEFSHPIKFRDLPIRTHIVATDLLAARVKVWSTTTTPDESVAFAVRASCSIPFFFQPAAQGENRFVDGGVLSNLPAMVFSQDRQPNEPPPNRILGFALQSTPISVAEWSTDKLIGRLISAVVDGATDLQQRQHPGMNVIRIDTGDVQATDFERMDNSLTNQLIDAGKNSVASFVRNEHLLISQNGIIRQTCADSDEFFNAIVQEALRLPTRFIICEADTEWVWKLFPSLLLLKLKGCHISTVLEPIRGNDIDRSRENYRRKLLAELGIPILQVDSLPIQGYFFNPERVDGAAAIIYSPKTHDYSSVGVTYRGRDQYSVIKAASDLAVRGLSIPSKDDFAPSIVRLNETDIIDTLKVNVSQYRGARVSLNFEDIDLSKLLLVSSCVREFKFRQMEIFVEHIEELGFRPFEALGVKLKSGRFSIIAPPVVEVTGDNLVAVEGHTRFMVARIRHSPTLRGIVVRGVSEQLPARPIKPKFSRIVSRNVAPGSRMMDFNYSFFRKIENALHREDSLD